jgi:hypothetical protein
MYRNEVPENTMCAFWGENIQDGITIARYHRTETRTPFDIHWTKGGDYFQNFSPNYLEAISQFRAETRHRAETGRNEPPHFIV